MPRSDVRSPAKRLPKRPKPALHRHRKRPVRRAYLKNAFTYEDDRHPVHVYLSGLGEDSARVMGSALESIADILSDGKRDATTLAWHQIRSEHVSTLRGRLQKLYAPATATRYLTALRAVLKEAWRLELIDREVVERSIDVPPIKGSRAPRGRAVLRDELVAVFAVCAEASNTTAGVRDAAIIALLYGCGLRRAEAAALEFEQFDPDAKTLKVHGKGNKARTVFLPPGASRALEPWLRLRGSGLGPLFCRVTPGGNLRMRPISPQLIYLIVRQRHRDAGIDTFTPHDLRRSFISDLLDGGIDLATIARQVGHENVQTTARYDRRSERAQQQAALGVDVPFKR